VILQVLTEEKRMKLNQSNSVSSSSGTWSRLPPHRGSIESVLKKRGVNWPKTGGIPGKLLSEIIIERGPCDTTAK